MILCPWDLHGPIRQSNHTVNTLLKLTLKVFGLQAPVEDGLVHVDIALPDYKLAFFLENAQHAASGQGHHPDSNALNG